MNECYLRHWGLGIAGVLIVYLQQPKYLQILDKTFVMATISAKFFEIFRNLKSDAVPRPPRPETENFNNHENQENLDENVDESNADENGPDMTKKDKKKSTSSSNFFKPNKNKNSFGFPKKKEDKEQEHSTNSNVNVQATGNVINIVNSRDVHWGNEVVYYMGPTNVQQKTQKDVENIEKSNIIILVMEATIKPNHEYIDYISKNLGRDWHSIFISLGYSKNRIETFEIDEAGKGISEVRYKLLLDWVRNDDDGTLGKLTTYLWEEGERQLVKELAIMYKKDKK